VLWLAPEDLPVPGPDFGSTDVGTTGAGSTGFGGTSAGDDEGEDASQA